MLVVFIVIILERLLKFLKVYKYAKSIVSKKQFSEPFLRKSCCVYVTWTELEREKTTSTSFKRPDHYDQQEEKGSAE